MNKIIESHIKMLKRDVPLLNNLNLNDEEIISWCLVFCIANCSDLEEYISQDNDEGDLDNDEGELVYA